MTYSRSASAAKYVATDPTPRPVRTWSAAQEAVFAAVTARTANLSVNAVAGSGKTTTLIEALFRYREQHPSHRVLFVAFSKNVATELSSRVPRGVNARTLHSLGLDLVRQVLPRVEVDGRKPYVHARPALSSNGISTGRRQGFVDGFVRAIADVYTQVDPITPELVQRLRTQFSWRLDLSNDVIEKVLRLIDEYMRADKTLICFDEMLTWSLLPGALFPSYDLIMVDEAQDLNPVQEEMMARLCQENTRLVIVGDPNQSVYAFRGADPEAMPRMQERFNMTQLPLSVSYRCPKAVVAMAQGLVPRITAADAADDGVVIHTTEGAGVVASLQPGDLIIGRRNSTVIRWCLWLITQGRRAKMLGRDIGKIVAAPVDKMQESMQGSPFPAVVLACIEDLLSRSMAADDSRDEKKRQGLLDLAKTIEAVASDCRTYEQFKERMEEIHIDDGEITDIPPILCSTIHRAKGREANTIVWMEPSFNLWMRDRMVDENRPADAQQEDNLRYVAITRAKKALYCVEV